MPIDGENGLSEQTSLPSPTAFYPESQIARAPLAPLELRVGGLCEVQTRTNESGFCSLPALVPVQS